MNLGEFYTEIRLELKDDGATPKWSDALLYVFLRDGIYDFSEVIPLEKSRVELTVDGSDPQKFDLPTDFLSEVLVESPLDYALSKRYFRPGVRWSESQRTLQYWIQSTALYVDADPGSDGVHLSYRAVHGIPANATDTSYTLTIPDRDIELIKLYVMGRVYQRERSRQSMLDRFKVGSSDREDNPVTNEYNAYMYRYIQEMEKRRGGKTIMLVRVRRRK